MGVPAGQPEAAPSDPGPPAPEPAPADEAAPATQVADPAAQPAGGAPNTLPDRPYGTAAATQASKVAAPATPPARGTGPKKAKSASAGRPQGAAVAANKSREDAKYRAHTQPSYTHVSPPQDVPAERVPGAQGRLPQRETTAQPRPGP